MFCYLVSYAGLGSFSESNVLNIPALATMQIDIKNNFTVYVGQEVPEQSCFIAFLIIGGESVYHRSEGGPYRQP